MILKRRPTTGWKERALLSLGGVVAGLVVAEIALRILGISYPIFYSPDPYCGHSLRPGVEGYWLKEGRAWVHINSQGLRDREHAIKKPPNTFRIAVLGDSYAQAFQVDEKHAFWTVLERNLSACEGVKGKKVEVINFGQSGFGTTSQLLALQHRVWKYAPDVVLLQFFTGNDIADNHRALKKDDTYPFYVYRNGELVLEDSHIRARYRKMVNWFNELTVAIHNRFWVIQVVHKAIRVAGEKLAHSKTKKKKSTSKGDSRERGLDESVYRPPVSRHWKEAWKVTEALLLKMRDAVRNRGAGFYVVVVCSSIAVHPDPLILQKQRKKRGVNHLFYPDFRIRRFCTEQGIPVLLLGPYFQQCAAKHKVFFHGFPPKLGKGHWNENGHRLAGDMIAKWLCEKWSG